MSILSNDIPNSTFIHIPKCAGISVSHWYSESFSRKKLKSYNHAPVKYFKEELGLDNHFTWSIVRNPYDRAVSWYQYQGYLLKFINEFFGNNDHWNISRHLLERFSELDYRENQDSFSASVDVNHLLNDWNKGFDYWLENCSDTARMEFRTFPTFVDPDSPRFDFKTNQTWWLTDSKNNIVIDQFVKFENINNELPIIEKQLNKSIRLQHLNPTVKNETITLNKWAKKKIETIFQDDFDRLNY